MPIQLPTIYPVTDTAISGLSHPEQVRRLIAGGARFIQIREKKASPREFYAAAEESVRIARENGVTLLINDRVDIALALKADGVHLGQDDLPPEYAREMLGPEAIIGFSTHSAGQAAAAAALPIDYIAIGPIFGTSTKEKPDPVVGLGGLREVRGTVRDFPLVAIGGIERENIAELLDAGADSLAIIRALLSDPEAISERIAEFSRSRQK